VWLIYSGRDMELARTFKDHLSPWKERLDLEDRFDHLGKDVSDVIRACPSDTDFVWIVTVESLSDEAVTVEVEAAAGRKITPIVAGASLWETAPELDAHRGRAVPRDPQRRASRKRLDDAFWNACAIEIWGRPRELRRVRLLRAVAPLLVLVAARAGLSFAHETPSLGAAPLAIGVTSDVPAEEANGICKTFAEVDAHRSPICVPVVSDIRNALFSGTTVEELQSRAAATGKPLVAIVARGGLSLHVAELESTTATNRATDPLRTLLDDQRIQLPRDPAKQRAIAQLLTSIAHFMAGDPELWASEAPLVAPDDIGADGVVAAGELLRDIQGASSRPAERRVLLALEARCRSGVAPSDPRKRRASASEDALCCLVRYARDTRAPDLERKGTESGEDACDGDGALRALALERARRDCLRASSLEEASRIRERAGRIIRASAFSGEEAWKNVLFLGLSACAESLNDRFVHGEPDLLLSDYGGPLAQDVREDISPREPIWQQIAAANLAQRGLLHELNRAWTDAEEDFSVAVAIAESTGESGVGVARSYRLHLGEVVLQSGRAARVLEGLTPDERWSPATHTHAAFLRWLAARRLDENIRREWNGLLRAEARLVEEGSGARGVDDAWLTLEKYACRDVAPAVECTVYSLLTQSQGEGEQRSLREKETTAMERP